MMVAVLLNVGITACTPPPDRSCDDVEEIMMHGSNETCTVKDTIPDSQRAFYKVAEVRL